MKILTKELNIGEEKYLVSVDRNITANTFEHFPEFSEKFFNFSESMEGGASIVGAIKSGTLTEVLETKDYITDKKYDVVKYAFPLMLSKADKENGTDNASKADEILKFIEDNDGEDVFSSAMFEFICLGFTNETEEKKSKVQIALV